MNSPGVIGIDWISILIIDCEVAAVVNLWIPIRRLLDESVVEWVDLVNGDWDADEGSGDAAQTAFELSVDL